MQYRHFVVTVILILALVMTSGCTGLLMGDLKAEIHDTSSIPVPLPLSSVLSVLASRNTTTLTDNQSLTDEKKHTGFGNLPADNSLFHVNSSTTDPTGMNTDDKNPEPAPSHQDVENRITLKAPAGELVIPHSGTAACIPVGGVKVTVTRIGTPDKTHIADCITQKNGDFSFYVPPPMEKSGISFYTFNFKISAPGYNLPAGTSDVVTDMANVSAGPLYTFNVCFQQPSEPNSMAVTRGGIAVSGRIST